MGKERKLSGKVAFITGGDSGIGEATAIEFANEGADVVITYHTDKDAAQNTLKKIEEAGQSGMILKMDQSKEVEVEETFDKALDKFGSIDILFNNAGLNYSEVKLADMDTETFDKIIKTNLYGYFYCCRRFVQERLKNNGGGKIINVSSVHEEIPKVGATAYHCSKGAIKNLTQTMALELAEHGINVNAIAPGMILTPMNQEAIERKLNPSFQVYQWFQQIFIQNVASINC
ncbi:MAG: SDR family NAD(P)-dependent oxidoreductase [Bacteroidetes bacterium]|nr:SDR family NAD(P)-dependent oxidoreductase [Bacteroidota bacterium]